jgi:hypothetical protein
MERGLSGIERCRLLDGGMRGLRKGLFLGIWTRRCRLGLVVFTCDVRTFVGCCLLAHVMYQWLGLTLIE